MCRALAIACGGSVSSRAVRLLHCSRCASRLHRQSFWKLVCAFSPCVAVAVVVHSVMQQSLQYPCLLWVASHFGSRPRVFKLSVCSWSVIELRALPPPWACSQSGHFVPDRPERLRTRFSPCAFCFAFWEYLLVRLSSRRHEIMLVLKKGRYMRLSSYCLEIEPERYE